MSSLQSWLLSHTGQWAWHESWHPHRSQVHTHYLTHLTQIHRIWLITADPRLFSHTSQWCLLTVLDVVLDSHIPSQLQRYWNTNKNGSEKLQRMPFWYTKTKPKGFLNWFYFWQVINLGRPTCAKFLLTHSKIINLCIWFHLFLVFPRDKSNHFTTPPPNIWYYLDQIKMRQHAMWALQPTETSSWAYHSEMLRGLV